MVYDIIDFIRNKHFDELKEYSPYIRQATLFKLITEQLPLKVTDNDYIAGWYGYENGCDITLTEKRNFEHVSILNDEQRQRLRHLYGALKIEIDFNRAHTCVDYETIVQNGLEYYMKRVDAALCESPDDDCLLAMKIALNAVCQFSERFAATVYEKIKDAKEPEQKKRLEKIHTALCRVPKSGARNFLEAVQSVWIMHLLIPIAEMSWASISIGRIDQYLYPFYKKHIEDGGSKEELREILKNLFLLLDSYGDGACAMNIGGMDADGKDMINDLSRLLIEVEKEMLLRAPIFAVRITPDIPEDVFDSLIDFDLFKIGQPTFYGEIPCRKAMSYRGVTESDAVGYSVNSCMGLIVPGQEFADMWGIKFNSHLPLELAINKGNPLNAKIELELKTVPEDIEGFEHLLQKYNEYLCETVAIAGETYEQVALEQEANTPDPLLSALTDGCIQNRRDRSNGATYNTVTVETMGLINTCDALSAIKELVFEKGKYTLNDFIVAAKDNFDGHEKLLHDISKCEKYGTNEPQTNALCNRVCDMVSRACKAINHDNRLFLPSLHTLIVNMWYGDHLYATLDGRKKGEPVNKNANPSSALQKIEHTSVILSAAALEQYKFSGGQPIDLYFDAAWFKDKALRDKVKALIRTYVQQGGLQLQVNSADIELLEKAHAEPEKYPFVIVRIGGYSARFGDLSFDERREFIETAKRTERLV